MEVAIKKIEIRKQERWPFVVYYEVKEPGDEDRYHNPWGCFELRAGLRQIRTFEDFKAAVLVEDGLHITAIYEHDGGPLAMSEAWQDVIDRAFINGVQGSTCPCGSLCKCAGGFL